MIGRCCLCDRWPRRVNDGYCRRCRADDPQWTRTPEPCRSCGGHTFMLLSTDGALEQTCPLCGATRWLGAGDWQQSTNSPDDSRDPVILDRPERQAGRSTADGKADPW